MQQSRSVYIFGRGGDGQLGHGDYEDQPTPRKCAALEGREVVHLGCGGKHTLVCLASGDVYAHGWGASGQLGLGDTRDAPAPTLVKLLALYRATQGVKFVAVAAGDAHSLMLADNGTLFSTGANTDGQLGLGSKEGTQLVPRIVLGLHKMVVAQIASGSGHCLALTNNGLVFSWGRGNNGRLGHGDEESVSEPRQVKTISNVRQVACGWSHSLCIDQGHKLWTWGKGIDGQLGHGEEADEVSPRVVSFFLAPFAAVRDVTAGYYHSAVLVGASNDVYTFGWGEHGQLGLGDTSSVSIPRLLEPLIGQEVVHVACGGLHSIASTSDGRCFSWGSSQFGQLGYECDEGAPELQPRLIEALSHVHTQAVAAGYWHTIAVTNNLRSSSSSPAPSFSSLQDSESAAEEDDLDGLRRVLDRASLNASAAREPFVDLESAIDAPHSGGAAQVSSMPIDFAIPACASDTSMNSIGFSQARKRGPLQALLAMLAKIFDLNDSARRTASDESIEQAQLTAAVEKSEKLWRESVLPNWRALHARGKLYRLVRQGVPPAIRGTVWIAFIGNALNITPQLFEQAKAKARAARLGNAHNQEARQSSQRLIEVDLPRTFPKLRVFSEMGPFAGELSELLEAFAIFNPELGYVQGMSFLAGMLLLHMDQAHAFTCLCNMLNNHFFESLFQLNIRECLKHIKVYELLFFRHLPQLHKHFTQLGISPEHYLLDWFFSVFSKALPFNVAVRIWDSFLLEGEVFLFRAALALLKTYRKRLLSVELDECVPLLRHLPEDIDEKALFDAIESITVPGYVHQFIHRILQAQSKSQRAKKDSAKSSDDGDDEAANDSAQLSSAEEDGGERGSGAPKGEDAPPQKSNGVGAGKAEADESSRDERALAPASERNDSDTNDNNNNEAN